jgi:hypothetical protein
MAYLKPMSVIKEKTASRSKIIYELSEKETVMA